ncbi:MAG: hypothetical protein DME02_04520 [Candidatus Rokuibacteriota bacterium]|nr:MAG: hypothetical protein DME02_04520 [Candidatus Rokubacteria bacterium]
MNQPRLRILIVDDAGPVVVLCVNVLQALGYAVKGANRGETAVELLRKERFDLMVLDYNMPGMPFTSEELRGTVEKVLTDRKQDSR